MIARRQLITGAGLVAAGSLTGLLARAGGMQEYQGPAVAGLRRNPDLDGGAAPPPPGFGSNRNYYIYGEGQPIRGLKVTIDVEQDILAPGAMSIQLNVNSPANATCVYQQYCTALDPHWGHDLGIGWSIENFPSKPFRWKLHEKIGLPCGPGNSEETCKGNLYNYPPTKGPFATFPNLPNDRIPAGFKIIHELVDDPSSGAIVGARYTVIDHRGRAQSVSAQILHSFKFVDTQKDVGPDGVAPNFACQINMVGLHGGEHTDLQSGAGTITYEATTQMRAVGQTSELQGVYLGTPGTGETSNLVYSKLPAAPSRRIVQRFGLPGGNGAGVSNINGGFAGGGGEPTCPSGQTYNSLAKQCEYGRGHIISNDQAPPNR